MSLECEFRKDECCEVASQIVAHPVPTNESICRACQTNPQPKSLNNVTCSIAISSVADKDEKRKLIEKYQTYIQIGMPRRKLEDGPGTELHKLLKTKGYEIDQNCPCLTMIRRMNREGLVWCYDNIRTEIVPAMVAESFRRKIKVAGISPPEIARQLQAEKWVRDALRSYRRRTAIKNEHATQAI